jgi:ankyrin repeat protein
MKLTEDVKKLLTNQQIRSKFAKSQDVDWLKRTLIELKYPDADTKGEVSLINLAVEYGDSYLLRLLLEAGYSPLIQFSYGGSLLHAALENSSKDPSLKCARILIDGGGMNANTDANGRTPSDIMGKKW